MLSLDEHLYKLKELSASIDTLYYRPPGIFTNAILVNPEITALIRDLEQPEKGIFRVVPIGSGAEKKRANQTKTSSIDNVGIDGVNDTDYRATNGEASEESLTSAVMRGSYDVGYGFYDEVEEMRPAESLRPTVGMTSNDQSVYLKQRMDQLIESILREVDPSHNQEMPDSSLDSTNEGRHGNNSDKYSEVKFGNVNILVAVIERLKELYNPHGCDPDLLSGIGYDLEIIEKTREIEFELKRCTERYQEAISSVFDAEQLYEKQKELVNAASKHVENKWIGRNHKFMIGSRNIHSETTTSPNDISSREADEKIKAYEDEITRLKALIDNTQKETDDLKNEARVLSTS